MSSFSHEIWSAGGYALFCVVLLALRRVLGTFWAAALYWVGTLVYLKVGFDPAIPESLFKMFGGVALLGVIIYVTSSEAGTEAFFRPIKATMTENTGPRLLVLGLLMVLVPAAIAFKVYSDGLPSGIPPAKVRNIHPAPPNTINYQGPEDAEAHAFDIIKDDNPFRPLEKTDPARWAEAVARGKTVYYENCFYCHGDTLAGDGHYAGAMTPPPAKFTAPDTIPMLEEAFLFWRVAKGGPGLPEEGTPFDSTMPVWEKFLSEEDVWSVISFLYDFTGYEPRSKGGGGDHGGGH